MKLTVLKAKEELLIDTDKNRLYVTDVDEGVDNVIIDLNSRKATKVSQGYRVNIEDNEITVHKGNELVLWVVL